MRKLSDLFLLLSPGWVALLASITFGLFMVFVLPGQATEAQSSSGGVGSPDTSFWYSAQELYYFAEAYGESGRAAYIRARWTFDLIYPLIYGSFLVATISWVYPRAFPSQSGWYSANLIPFFAVIFDYLENIATSLVMGRYPQSTTLIASLAPYLSLLKWIFVLVSFVALLAGSVLVLYRSIQARFIRGANG